MEKTFLPTTTKNKDFGQAYVAILLLMEKTFLLDFGKKFFQATLVAILLLMEKTFLPSSYNGGKNRFESQSFF